MQFINTKKLLNGFEEQGEIPSEKEIIKSTLKMAWPSVLESFLISLTSFVDTIMVSSLGATAVAAIGITVQPKFIALCIFMSLSTALASVVSRRRGEKNRESANAILRMALFWGTILTIILTALSIFGADFIIKFAGSAEDTHDLAVEYYLIISAGMIFNVITMIVNACQRGSGNTKIAMKTNVTANIINVIFNYLLIQGNLGFPALGIKGAAYATVLGTMVACVMSIISITHPTGFMYVGAVKSLIASKTDIKAITNVGSSAFVEQICMRVGFLLFFLTVANLGTTLLATHQIGMNFMNISFSFADGLAVASVALVGRSLGEKRQDMARIYSKTCQRLGIICAMVVAFVYFFFGKSLFGLFTDDPVIMEKGVMIMNILCVLIFVQIEQITIIGSLRGAGDTKYTAFISLISVAIIRPIASWALCYPLGFGLLGVWLGLAVDQSLRLFLGWRRFKQGKWLKIKL
ncbi:MAG: MATE family efflux transporter [Clostridia bacterium]